MPETLQSVGGPLIEIDDIGGDIDWTARLQGVGAVTHLTVRVNVMQETAADPLACFRRVSVLGTQRLAEAAVAARRPAAGGGAHGPRAGDVGQFCAAPAESTLAQGAGPAAADRRAAGAGRDGARRRQEPAAAWGEGVAVTGQAMVRQPGLES